MKCIIPGPNVKVFGRAIHSLSKIGDELYLEALDNGYNDISTGDSEDEVLKCKIGMKSCLTVFRSLSSLDKTVDKCKIRLDMKQSRLIFQLFCRHGITKTHNLSFIECETLQAIFSKEMTPNILTAPSRLFGDAVLNFQNNQEEVSLIISPERVTIKNYIEDEPDPKKVIRTELSMDPDEFDNYQVGVDTEVTFCLKELRAILSFTDPNNLPLSAHFETAGKPILFCIDSDPSFEGNFVLATLAEPNGSQVTNTQNSQRTSTTNIHPTKSPALNTTQQNKSHTIPSRLNKPTNRPATCVPNRSTPSVPNRSTLSVSNNVPKSHERRSPSTSSAMETTYRSFLHEDDEPQAETSRTNTGKIDAPASNIVSRSFTNNVSKATVEAARSNSPVIPILARSSRFLGGGGGGDEISVAEVEADDKEEEDDMVPDSPPAKKFKSLFFGLSQSSTQASSQPTASSRPQVLAEDTDEED